MMAMALIASVSVLPCGAVLDVDGLRAKLQAVVQTQSAFWNASISFAVHNSTFEVRVVGSRLWLVVGVQHRPAAAGWRRPRPALPHGPAHVLV